MLLRPRSLARGFLRTSLDTQRRSLITYEAEEIASRSHIGHRLEVYERKRDIGRNKRGNLYRRSAKPFASVEQMERKMSELAFSPGERMHPMLLPKDVAQLQLEGSAVDLLEAPPLSSEQAHDALVTSSGMESASLEERAQTALASREDLVDELTSNVLSETPWAALGLDPAVAHLAAKRFGAHATRVQARLVPALIHEDHRDVVFSSATGSGKTAALILAALHGVRTESAGVNFVVLRSSDVAYAAYSLAQSIVGRDVGGSLVDLEPEDMRWMMYLEGKDAFREHAAHMKQVARECRAGPRLVFTTADVIAELLFQTKMEFKPFGNLRRLYFDDACHQFNVVRPGFYESSEEVKAMQDAPSAADLVAATLHQIPVPHVRALLQIATVAAGMDTALKDHLKKMCIQPQRHSIIVAPARLPSHVHVLFSFFQLFTHAKPDAPLAVPLRDVDEYTVQLIRNLNTVIPGRAVIFVAPEVCLLTARAKYRALGMDARIACEVFKNGKWEDDDVVENLDTASRRPPSWRFVIMHEHEGFGVDIPRLSHVFITFCPSDRFSMLHMLGRVGRLGAPGWAFVVTDQRDAPTVATLAEELDVDVTQRSVTLDLRTCPPEDVRRWAGEGSLSPLDPRYVVERHYEELENDARGDVEHREMWDRDPKFDFWQEDYRDPKVVTRKFRRAEAIRVGIEKDPRLVTELYRDGLVNEHMRPTQKFHALLEGRAVRR